MLLNLRRAVVVSAIFFVILGLAYPIAETGIGRVLFHHKATGSIGANGSSLIGQKWTGAKWFQGRPDGFDPSATGGSNLGTRSQDLLNTYKKRVKDLEARGITPNAELIAQSGSGVDPDISPAAAYAQVNAVAKARGMSADKVHDLVADHVHGPEYGFLGASYVNVLELNEALASQQ